MNSSFFRAFRWLALVFLAVSGLLFFLDPIDAPNSQTASLPDGFDSTYVAAQREAAAGEDREATAAALVLFTGPVTENMDLLRGKAEALGGPLIPNDDATAVMIPLQVADGTASGSTEAIEQLRADAREGLPDSIEASVTGPAAIRADLAGVFSGANVKLLAVTAAIVAVLLVFTYRSPILWVIPLAVIGLADRLVALLYPRVLDALGIQWDESTGGILSVLVFGAGTNYALLLISRYRDELTQFHDRFEAMARAWIPTLRTTAASASTVILGVLCLLASHTPTTRSLGAAAAFGVAVAFLFGMFVLPGVLLLFGNWIFWPRRPEVGDETNHTVFNAVGRTVQHRPAAILAASLLALGVMSLGATNIVTGLTQSDQFIDTPESISAAQQLSDAYPDISATPAVIATDDIEGTTRRLEDAGLSPRPAEDGFLEVSGATTEELRSLLGGSGALVGGGDAELYDTETAAAEDRRLIFPLVLSLIFGALLILLRSVVAPLVMTGSVLLTNAAALGLGWWLSHHLLGFERFDSTTPLYAFVFLVALGIDYSIFLVTRAREDSRATGTRAGILSALGSTGAVITSAGILLAAVFAALGVLPLVVLAQIGIVICIGVLLDTLIVRSLVVPAIVLLFGEKFWWPARPASLGAHAETSNEQA